MSFNKIIGVWCGVLAIGAIAVASMPKPLVASEEDAGSKSQIANQQGQPGTKTQAESLAEALDAILFSLRNDPDIFAIGKALGLSSEVIKKGMTKSLREEVAKRAVAQTPVQSSSRENETQIIHEHCRSRYPQDFEMRAYCERKQWEGVRELNKNR